MTQRTVTGLLALTFLLSACPGAPPPLEPPGPDPDPVTRGVSTIEGELGGWTLGSAFVTLTGGYDVEANNGTEVLTMMEPNYIGELNENGMFSVDLASEPVDPEDMFSLGCTADSPEIAVISIGLVSETGTIASSDDALADITLRPGDALIPQVIWIYMGEDYAHTGRCDSTDNLLSLGEIDVNLVKGWNAVLYERITFGASITTLESTGNYQWLPAF